MRHPGGSWIETRLSQPGERSGPVNPGQEVVHENMIERLWPAVRWPRQRALPLDRRLYRSFLLKIQGLKSDSDQWVSSGGWPH